MSMNLKASFVNYLAQKYPHLKSEVVDALVSDNLLSPFQIKLSPQIIQSIRGQIQKYWKLRQWTVSNLGTRYDSLGLRRSQNFGVCMSYDFHISVEQKPELIEINTNASFLALGLELYEFLGLKEVVSNFDSEKLIKMFQQENILSGKKDFRVSILDEKPNQQRLYVEFLIYQSLFKEKGIPCSIADLEDTDKLISSTLVYNRYTDFFLETEKSKSIRNLYNNSEIELSPNPYEYFLMADKGRFIDWTEQKEFEIPESLLLTYDLGKVDKEKIWAERKNLFFKPKNSFGGKQTYRGSSISRKIFEEVTNSQFIAQKISPPSEIEVDFNSEKTKFKYDLRCFAYQDQLQMIIARLYQGQTTNLRTPGGGFACIIV